MATFLPGDIVKIDKKGSARVLNVTEDNMVNVEIIGIDYNIELSPRRLTKIPSTVTSALDVGQEYLHETEPVQERALSTSRASEPPAQAERSGTARFKPVSEEDVADLIVGEENQNTARKTAYDIRLLKQFQISPQIAETREIYDIPPGDLNKLLSKFFVSVRKSNGENYEPGSLRSMLSSFERYLKRHGYSFSLITDQPFHKLRETIKSKQKELKREGKGNLPNKAEPATDEEIDTLWKSGQLGSHSPMAIINSLWFFSTIHFGLRGDTEHRNMCWGDVSLRTDNNDREYLEFSERQTKTRTGINPRDIRSVKPKMWDVPENPNRCPVQIYKKFASLRPSDFCKTDDPFYIATNTIHEIPNPGELWFRKQPIGKNKIGSLMKKMAANADLPSHKKLTNSSARKRLLQKLSDENVPPTHIMQISGHRNIQSVNAYSSISENQHRQISGILNSTSCNNTQLSTTSVPHCQSSQQNQLISSQQNTASRMISSTTTTSEMAPIFGGPISGGVFHVHVHYSGEAPKRRRIRVIESSESSQEG